LILIRLFTCRYMNTFIQYIKPKGPGGVDFLSVKGLPVLSDINTGRFNGAHFPKLFVTRHAPGAAFYCWKGVPSAVVDVYGYWNKLVAEGIAFIPGKSNEGVFPLLYLRGGPSPSPLLLVRLLSSCRPPPSAATF